MILLQPWVQHSFRLVQARQRLAAPAVRTCCMASVRAAAVRGHSPPEAVVHAVRHPCRSGQARFVTSPAGMLNQTRQRDFVHGLEVDGPRLALPQ